MKKYTKYAKYLRTIKTLCLILFPPLLYIGAQIILRDSVSITSSFRGNEAAFSAGALFPVIACIYALGDDKKQTRRYSPMPLSFLIVGIICLCLCTAYIARFAHIDTEVPSVVLLAGMGLFGPINEELIYRGFVLQNSRKLFSPAQAIILSSLIFAAAHSGVVGFAAAFGAGLFFALLSYNFGLWAPIAAHVIVNLISFVPGIYVLPIWVYIPAMAGLALTSIYFMSHGLKKSK